MQTLTLTPQTYTGANIMHTHTHTHTHTLQVAHTQTSQTPAQSHKEEEVFQAVCKTQGDPLIGCVIMIRLKLRGEKKREKRQTHSAGP